jgi:hypothetical protein
MAKKADTQRHTEIDITVKRGDTLNANNATFTVKDDAGVDIDLSGYDSAQLDVVPALGSASTILSLTSGASQIVLANGSFHLDVTATVMDIAAGRYKYEMKIVTGTTEIVIQQGNFIVNQNIVA